jgi:diacylglycerol kinase family enzyme
VDGALTQVRFGIVANPKAGTTSISRKARVLQQVGEILGADCVIDGLDTQSKAEFTQCAHEMAQKADVLIVAGGDGTVSDVINAVDLDTTFSYLPFGSGCALRYALDLPPQLTRVAKRIREGQLRCLDLILCDGARKAFMASVGIEGDILNRRESLRESGINGPPAYAMATFGSFFADLERTRMSMFVDGVEHSVPEVVTTIVTKIPYYGYKMKVVPNAVFDDGYLHLLAVNSGWGEIVQNLANALINENKLGIYKKASEIRITTHDERYAQVDGNIYRKGTSFHYQVLPGVLKMWY